MKAFSPVIFSVTQILVNPPAFSISIDELNLESYWYTIDNGQINITITELTGVIDEDAWNTAQTGSLTIRFYARDEAGNIGYSEVIILKVSSGGGGGKIPGFNLLSILSILSLITVFYIKKRLKKL